MTDNPMRSPLYQRTLDALSIAINDWMRAHPGADPQFKFPPDGTIVTGELRLGLDWWEPNQDGAELLAYAAGFVAQTCNGYEPSMLQFQVCYRVWQSRGKARG